MYRFRKALLSDHKEVMQLYINHSDEVELMDLSFNVKKFFRGQCDDTFQLWVCINEDNDKIIGCFSIHISGEHCYIGSGLCHKAHRRLGPAKMARRLYRDIAKKNGCRYIHRRAPKNAVHIRLNKLEAIGWEIEDKGNYIELHGDLRLLDVENPY
jgi:hypothetical protein